MNTFPEDWCDGCKHTDPVIRYNHWLEFDSLHELEQHVETYIKLPEDRVAILRSYRNTKENWEGMAHPATGATMHWRDARQMAFRDARARQDARTQERSAQKAAEAPQDATTQAALVQRIIASIPKTKDPWALGHLTMMTSGVNKPGREAAAVAFCEAMAQKYPQDAADWLKEAEDYGRILAGVEVADSDLPF